VAGAYLQALGQAAVAHWVSRQPGSGLDVVAQSVLGSLATTATAGAAGEGGGKRSAACGSALCWR
jgi:hypothetical protein